jgi:hypothetical protein
MTFMFYNVVMKKSNKGAKNVRRRNDVTTTI